VNGHAGDEQDEDECVRDAEANRTLRPAADHEEYVGAAQTCLEEPASKEWGGKAHTGFEPVLPP